MSLFDKILPTSKSIQKEYVEKRKRALDANDPEKTKRVEAAYENFKDYMLLIHGTKIDTDWYDLYKIINAGLRASDLTINIDAGSWFSQRNNYKTYAQMYTRAKDKDGKVVLADAGMNPANLRAGIDDVVTLPEEWANAPAFSQRARIHKAMNFSGGVSDPGNGLTTPGLKSQGKAFVSTNKSFKAGSKQVFAGLNFGKRHHGSTFAYGYSYLILNPALKFNALYYPSDTFLLAGPGVSSQATYLTLGAVLERMSNICRESVYKACVLHQVLPDTNEMGQLIEAHIFKKVKIAEDVQDLVLSRNRTNGEPAWTEAEWQNIVKNATDWCGLTSTRLTFASP